MPRDMSRHSVDPKTGKMTYRIPKGTPKQEAEWAEQREAEASGETPAKPTKSKGKGSKGKGKK